MWQDKLKEIEEAKKIFGKEVNEGATRQEVELLKKVAEEKLDIALPEEYLNVLGTINGIEFNGFILYGIDENILGRISKQHINGLVDCNEIWYENEWQKQYIFLGESGISWYVFDIETGKYQILDMPSGELCEEFEHFEDMLENLLSDSLM